MTEFQGAYDKRAVILASVKSQFGISFSETGTGGGCMALEARLESGHWIVATDVGLCGFTDRIVAESFDDNYNSFDGEDPRALGWSIGIYAHDAENNTWMGSCEETLVDVTDYDAYADALPDMVGKALAKLVSAAR